MSDFAAGGYIDGPSVPMTYDPTRDGHLVHPDTIGPVQLSRGAVAVRSSGVKWLPLLCAINGSTVEGTDVHVIPDDEPFPTSI